MRTWHQTPTHADAVCICRYRCPAGGQLPIEAQGVWRLGAAHEEAGELAQGSHALVQRHPPGQGVPAAGGCRGPIASCDIQHEVVMFNVWTTQLHLSSEDKTALPNRISFHNTKCALKQRLSSEVKVAV